MPLMTDQFPPFVQGMLSAPPRAGEGVHRWLFQVARQLHAHLLTGEIVNLLEGRVANCGRFVPRQEIVSAVQNALPSAWQPGSQSQPVHFAPKWPSVNQKQREAIIRGSGELADLWEFPNHESKTAKPTQSKLLIGFSRTLRCCVAAN